MSDPHREPRPVSIPEGHRPGLFERLRDLLGLGGASIRDDIQEALQESTTTSDFSPQERTMLQNVLSLHELRVDDVMVPRADIIAVPAETSLAELLAQFHTAGHSRLPVHGDTLDDPRGMVHIRDFVDRLAGSIAAVPVGDATASGGAQHPASRAKPDAMAFDLSATLDTSDLIRPVLFAPPSMPALDLLVKMQATRTHMALVIDEYGGTDGLVTIEDIVETIVGDIEDEHDLDETPIIDHAADGSLVTSARASLEDVANALEKTPEELAGAGVEDVDTIGGLIVALAGHVPVRGELVSAPGNLEFEILDADPRRIKRLRIRADVADAPPIPASELPTRSVDGEDESQASHTGPRP